ncbi:hypothetical protein ZIOFF_041684 [Zingiber officinale]|uniref:Uncharacterized protein n=1 Tax=Zingiber officinale TaxID=94328 RepID=A0A8J5G7W2_ZINOF|nr:hypothetical protein ZIOFF_041684 [Zingiber officinale]
MASSSSSSSMVQQGSGVQKSPFSFAFSGTPSITSEKLNGKNYMDWSSAVEIWFLGQGLSDHLETQVAEHDDASKAEWQRVDYQLVSLLWQSIDPSLLVHYHSYKSCYDIWKKAKSVYANDIQRLYDSVHNLATLQMQDHDLTSYLNKAQSTIHQVKMHLTYSDPNKVLEKLDQMYMVFVLHGLHKNFDSVKNQVLTNPNIPTVDELIDRLVRVPLTDGSLKTEVDSAILFTNSDRGGRGRGRGRGGRGNRPQCSYCNRIGHTRDRCFTLHGFPAKSANMSQVFQFQIFVKGKELWNDINGANPAPNNEEEEYGKWKVEDTQIMSWILGSVEPSILLNLKSYKTSREMWDYLNKIYNPSNIARRFQLELELGQLSQGNISIQEFYSSFENLWAEYTDIEYASVPPEGLITIKNVHETSNRDRVKGEFEAIRSNLINRGPVPLFDLYVGELLMEEQRLITHALGAKNSIFYSNSGYLCCSRVV